VNERIEELNRLIDETYKQFDEEGRDPDVVRERLRALQTECAEEMRKATELEKVKNRTEYQRLVDKTERLLLGRERRRPITYRDLYEERCPLFVMALCGCEGSVDWQWAMDQQKPRGFLRMIYPCERHTGSGKSMEDHIAKEIEAKIRKVIEEDLP